MTTENAINRLRSMERCIPFHTRDDIRDFESLEMAIESIEQQRRWTSVGERLPDKYGYYLVTRTTRDAEIEKGYRKCTYIEVMMYTKHSHWGLSTCGVVAWMPLPEPYEGSDTK